MQREPGCQAAGPLHIHLWGHPQKQAHTTAGNHQEEKLRLWAFPPCAQRKYWHSLLSAHVNVPFSIYSSHIRRIKEGTWPFFWTENPVYLIQPFDWSVMKIHPSLDWSYPLDNFTCSDNLIWPEAIVHPLFMTNVHYKTYIPNNTLGLLSVNHWPKENTFLRCTC